jgi:hypothetical protein
MTATDALRSTRTGLWTPALEAQPGPRVQEVAAELDELGFGSLWLPEAYGREAFTGAQALLAATRRIVVGTGIASIYARGAMAANGAARLLEALTPGRFVLGLGVSHKPSVERDRKQNYLPPIQAMGDYLDDLDSAPYFGADHVMPPVVLAALGPKMLGVARDRTAGAHSYLVATSRSAGRTITWPSTPASPTTGTAGSGRASPTKTSSGAGVGAWPTPLSSRATRRPSWPVSAPTSMPGPTTCCSRYSGATLPNCRWTSGATWRRRLAPCSRTGTWPRLGLTGPSPGASVDVRSTPPRRRVILVEDSCPTRLLGAACSCAGLRPLSATS